MLKSKFKAQDARRNAQLWASRLYQGWLRPSLYLSAFAFCLFFASGCRQDMQDQPRYEAYEPSGFFKDGLASRPLVEGTVARGYMRNDTEFYTGKIDRSRTGAATTAATAQNENGRASGGDAAQPEGQTTSPQGTLDSQNSNASGGGTQAGGTTASGANNSAPNQRGGAVAQGDPNDVETFPFALTAEVVNRGQERYKIFCAMCHGDAGYGDGMIVRRGFRKPPSYHTPELRAARVGHLFDVITNGWGSMPNYAAQVPPADRWAIIAYIRALQLSQAGATATDNSNAPQQQAAPGAPNTGGAK
jgi:mono/diheme cytochrome c family protein